MSDRWLDALGATLVIIVLVGIGSGLAPLFGFSRTVGALIWVSAVLWCMYFDRNHRDFT